MSRLMAVPDDAEVFTIQGGAGALAAFRIASRVPEEGVALLVPGFTGSREDFTCLLGPLADRGFSVLAYSQRGQLGSEGPGGYGPCFNDEGYRMDDFVSDLILVAETLPRRPHLLGHSLGGVIAMDAVLRRPDLFASYTHWNSGPRSRFAHEGDLRALEEGGSEGLWNRICPVPGALGVEEDWLRNRMLATKSGNLWGGAKILEDQVDRTEELAATGVPVLVSHGEFDEFWSHEWQEDMATRLGARYQVIAGGGHCAQLEQPVASADLLADFWREHPDS